MPQALKQQIRDNIADIRSNIAKAAAEAGRDPADVRLMAVTKTVSPQLINVALADGIGLIGENKVQELESKLEFFVPQDVEKHIIGHLQTNKVKQILPFVSMIQSVDSVHLAEEISKQAVRSDRTVKILIEVNIGKEESKSGFLPEAVNENLFRIAEMPGISVCGMMAVPPVCETESEIRKYFAEMRKIFIDNRDKMLDNKNMDILSLGMTGDYVSAVKEGSTLVRVGSGIFGLRRY